MSRSDQSGLVNLPFVGVGRKEEAFLGREMGRVLSIVNQWQHLGSLTWVHCTLLSGTLLNFTVCQFPPGDRTSPFG